MTDSSDVGTPRLSRSDKTATPDVSSGNRTRELATQACDACRARRRKCVFPKVDANVSQCIGCSRLHIQCSFNIPTRRRGPRTKRAQPSPSEASPEFHLASPTRHHDGQGQHSHQSPEGIAASLSDSHPRLTSGSPLSDASTNRPPILDPVLLAQDGPVVVEYLGHGFPTDEFCPRHLFMSIMSDYVDHIHPLIPVVHVPTFRADLAVNRDIGDLDFLCLIVALAVLTVGLLPSKFDDYQALAVRFGTRTAMINYCSQMCLRLRPADYWDHISHRKWAIAFSLAMGVFQVGQTNQSRMFEAESAQIARLLGIHRTSEYEGLNPIETQLRKKCFWLQLYAFTHSKVQPGRRSNLTYLDNYMLRDVDFAALEPVNLPDEKILKTGILGHVPSPSTGLPNNTVSVDDEPFNVTTVFIVASRVFLLGMRESMFNDGCDCGFGRTPDERLSRLRDLLNQLRYSLDGLPTHLRQWGPGDNYHSSGMDGNRLDASDRIGIAHAQDEIVRANLHVSHLWLQNFLLDKMDVVLQEINDARGPSAESAGETSAQLRLNWRDREDVARQLLHILHSIPRAYLEPNGLYLIYKARSVASSLLNCPFVMDRQLSQRVSEYVQEFTKVLSYLDRSEMVSTDGLRSWVDEDQYVNKRTG